MDRERGWGERVCFQIERKRGAKGAKEGRWLGIEVEPPKRVL